MEFADVLASSIHDIKNSLGVILTHLDDLLNNPKNQLADRHQASLLQHEAQRANNNLIQLLTLYKLGDDQLVVRVGEHNLEEFLEEVIADNLAVCRAMNLDLTYQCDPDLSGFFDSDLIRSVLDSTIGNARRYARERILLSAASEDGWLVLRVEDDGGGFPPSLIRAYGEGATSRQEGAEPGRTQLGLYFADMIAQAHQSGGRSGRLRLENAHALPGSCLELWLP